MHCTVLFSSIIKRNEPLLLFLSSSVRSIRLSSSTSSLRASSTSISTSIHQLQAFSPINFAARPGSPESLQQLVKTVKNTAATGSGLPSPVSVKDDKNRLTRDKKVLQLMASRGDSNNVEVMEPEASSFQQQMLQYWAHIGLLVSTLFAEWYRISELPAGNDAPCTKFMLHLHQIGLLRGDDKTERFFRVLLEISVSHFGEFMQKSPQVHTPFLAIDIYAKLVYSILKYWPVDQGSSKLFLLPKILTVTVRSIQKDADEKKDDFNPRPYFRLFINWLLDIGSIDVHDGVNFQVLSFFANAFHALQPLKVPAFSTHCDDLFSSARQSWVLSFLLYGIATFGFGTNTNILRGNWVSPKGFGTNTNIPIILVFDPVVRAVDGIAGECVSMRVDLECSNGQNTVGIFSHKQLSVSVGVSAAAFVLEVLEGSTQPGVWFPEEKIATTSVSMVDLNVVREVWANKCLDNLQYSK